jgi:CO dehydrogenase maturation factor
MKISVCGKGGSGKSTVVTLLANEAIARGYHVLVVDSDESNSGLSRNRGWQRAFRPGLGHRDRVGGGITAALSAFQYIQEQENETGIANH